MIIKTLTSLSVAILLVLPAGLQAATPTALEIITSVYDRPTGDDQKSNLTMTLTNSRGKTRVRKIQQNRKDLGDTEKSVMFFTSPADVRNTSFMSWSYDDADKSDDQWIYLPALKKVKRISSDGKSDYFMGSDFTYDDLGDRHPTADNHKITGEETIDGEACWVIESRPKDPDYMYQRTVVWVVKDTRIGKKKVFYDEDGEMLKTLSVMKVEKINGISVITHSRMKNVQKNHTTDMQLEKVKINTGLNNRLFTERTMKRGI